MRSRHPQIELGTNRMKSLLTVSFLALFPLLVQSASQYPDKAHLLAWKDDKNQFHAVTSKEEWTKRRRHILANMEAVMGTLPARKRISVVYLGEVRTDKFTRKQLIFRPEGYEPITAY